MKFLINESQYKRLLSEQKAYTSKTEYDKAIVRYEKDLKKYNIAYSKYQKELKEYNKVWGTPEGKRLIKKYGYGAVWRKGDDPSYATWKDGKKNEYMLSMGGTIPYPPKLDVKKPEKPIYQEPTITTKMIDPPVIEKPKPADPVKTNFSATFGQDGKQETIYFKNFNEWKSFHDKNLHKFGYVRGETNNAESYGSSLLKGTPSDWGL